FGDGANTAVNDVQRHLVRAELEQGIGECLYRATHIRLDDELQLLEIAKRKPAADFVERDVFLLAKRLLAMDLLSSLGDVAYLLFIVQYDELVAGFGSAVEAQNQRGLRGPRYIQTIIALIEHRTDAAAVDAGNERIADMKRAVLHENGRHDAPALFEARLDHHAVCVSVRIRPELQQLGLEQNAVEQVIHTFPRMRRHEGALYFPTVLLDEDIVLGELLHHTLRVGLRLVHLVDGNDDRHLGGLGVIDGLDRLRHHRIVGGNDKHNDVGDLRPTRTHGRKGLVAGRIQKRYGLAVTDIHLMCTDVLRDAAGLPRHHVRASDVVEQRRFPVVDMAHHRHDGGTWLQIFRSILLEDDIRGTDFRDELNVHPVLICDERNRVGVETLVDRDHHPRFEEHLDDLIDRHVHQVGQFAGRHKLRHPQNAFLLACLFHLQFSSFGMAFSPAAPPVLAGSAGTHLELPEGLLEGLLDILFVDSSASLPLLSLTIESGILFGDGYLTLIGGGRLSLALT